MPPLSRTSAAVVLAVVSLTAFVLGRFSRPVDAPPALAAASHPAATPATVTPRPDDAPDAPQAFDDAVAEPTTGYRQRLRLAQAAADLDRAGVIAALEREHARNPTAYSDRVWPTEALLARYAEIDPAAAMAWLVQTYRGDKLLWSWQSVVMEAWVSRDRKAAVAWVRGLPPGALYDKFASILLGRLTEVDPEMALRQGTRLGKAASYGFTDLFSKLAAQDVRAASERACHLPPDQSRQAVEGLMSYWAAHQPEDAYAWTMQLPAGHQRDHAVGAFYRSMVAKSPSDAAAWLTTHGSTDLPQTAGQVAQSWAKQDPAAACAWIGSLPAPARQQAQAQVVMAWANTDPRAALDYATASHLSNERTNAIGSALNTWARHDPAAAMGWAEKSAPASVRQQARNSVCSAWAQEDARGCVEYLSQQAAGDGAKTEPDAALHNAVAQWASQSPDEVWQWSQQLTDPKLRDSAAVSALGSLGRSDPATASARVAELPPENQPDAANAVASGWAMNDPAAAAAWAAALPTEAMQKDVCATVSRQWAYADAPGAAAWVDTQPPGASRDAAAEAVISSRPDSLEAVVAVRLAASIQDPQQRTSAFYQTIPNWVKQDRPAAEAWIGQVQEFTAAQRTQFLGTAQRDTSGVY